jgi:hypothetical protein
MQITLLLRPQRKVVSPPVLGAQLLLPEGLPREQQIDVEPFAARIIQRSGLELHHSEHEELLAFLISLTWELSLQYRPGIIHKGFSTWAGITLSRRITDWQRSSARGGRTKWQFADRTYERVLPDFISLDDRPDGPDSLSTVDLGRDSESPLEWIVRERDSEGTGRDNTLGQGSARELAA